MTTLPSPLYRFKGPSGGLTKPVRESLFAALAALNLASATALCARLMLRTVYRSEVGKGVAAQANLRRVLLLPRAGLNDDVINVMRTLRCIEVVALPRRVLKAIASAFLPPEVDDNNYISAATATKAGVQKYRDFLMRFWQAFDPQRKIEVVITGNFGYYAERELGASLEALDVPFIALHKENSWTRGGQAFWERIYREGRGRFCGRRILVYSPIERDLQLRSGVAEAARIEVVGMPRLDAVHRWRESHRGKIPDPVVLFASFPPDVGMPVVKRGGKNESEQREIAIAKEAGHCNLAELCRDAHRAVLMLAESCPDIAVIVKTKGRARDRERVAKLFSLDDKIDLPPNLQLVHGGSPLSLVGKAAAVGGLHSTLLLEALAAGRPVVVPWFAEVLDPIIQRYVFDLGEVVIRTSSPEEFADRLKELALRRVPVPQALSHPVRKLLREWLGNDDGKAGMRCARAISRAMNDARSEKFLAPGS